MVDYHKEHYRKNLAVYLWKRIKYAFGLTKDAWYAIFTRQGGGCAICRDSGVAPGDGGRNEVLNVDHCHRTGKIRGLLCSACNTMLGAAKDEPARLRAAISYLEQHQ